jgi:purine-binding chemotaxis protein CheW
MSEETALAHEHKLIVFRLGSEEYALNILRVQEIKKLMSITRVPNTPPYMKGVINLRGSIVPVVDLRDRLDLPSGNYTDSARIIVTMVSDSVAGFIVDEVVEVTTIDESLIESAQTVTGGISAEYLDGIAKFSERLFIMLNPDTIVGV